jgi:hypothetical protein
MSESNAIAERAPTITKTQIKTGSAGLVLTSIDEMYRFAEMVSLSGLAPKGIEKPAAICTALQMGLEIGLSPMQSLQSIAVINGRPGIYGDAAKALVESSGLMAAYDQWYELDGKKLVTADGYARTPTNTELNNDNLMCCVMSQREKRPPVVTTFSIGDAKRASLWGKSGPWTQYPARMMMFRARGFNLRDNFGDVLKGMRTDDELRDLPPADIAPLGPGERTNQLRDQLTQTRQLSAPVSVTTVPAELVQETKAAVEEVVTPKEETGVTTPSTMKTDAGAGLFSDEEHERLLRIDEQKRQSRATA